MDLLRCEICNSTITKFNNHECYYNELPFDRLVSEMLDYNFGNMHQETPATISHSAEGADFSSSAFMNRTSTLQSSISPESTDQVRHWDVNSTSGTNVRYASSNAIQNENVDYFNSPQGIFIPVTQQSESSVCTSGVENPAMAFFTAANTRELNPAEQPCPNNSAFIQHHPNLSFYNQLPPTSQGLEDPSNFLATYEPTNEYYNISMSIESRQRGMQEFEMPHFQEKGYDALPSARKSDRMEKNTSFASDLNCTSINVQYPVNLYTMNNSNHTPALQQVSTRSNTVMGEQLHCDFLNNQNSVYPNFENRDSYSIPDFSQGILDRQLGMNEAPHYSNKCQSQFDDKVQFQNVLQCHFCGSYQRNLKCQKSPANSSNVPFKCNECIETMKLEEKIQTRAKIAEVGHEKSAIKLQKIIKPREELFSCNVRSKRFPSPSSLKKHIFTHTKEKPFSCKICGRRFTKKSNMDVHTLTHSGIKRFQCNMCGESYTSNRNLLIHKLIHQSNN